MKPVDVDGLRLGYHAHANELNVQVKIMKIQTGLAFESVIFMSRCHICQKCQNLKTD